MVRAINIEDAVGHREQQPVAVGVEALVLLAALAIKINFSLFFFNLLPIPPLDGSRLVRNLLPYNAVQVYDRIPIWLSWLFMIVFGGMLIMLLLGPSMALVDALLRVL